MLTKYILLSVITLEILAILAMMISLNLKENLKCKLIKKL